MATPQGETLSRAVALRIHGSAASTAAVTAIPAEDRQDGMLVQVVGGTLWTYNAASAAVGSANVLVPDDAPSAGRWLSLSVLPADLASTANSKGASLVAIEDTGTLFTATNVEAALAEVKAIADAAQPAAKNQGGTLTLVDGTKTVSAGITITANSRVLLQMTAPGAGALGDHYKVTNKTAGAPGVGAFTVTAIASADGSTVATDVSVHDFVIVN